MCPSFWQIQVITLKLEVTAVCVLWQETAHLPFIPLITTHYYQSKYSIYYKQRNFGSSLHSFRRQWKPSTLQWLTHAYPAPHAKWPAPETAPCAASSPPHAAGKQEKSVHHFSMQRMHHITQITQETQSAKNYVAMEQGNAKCNLMSWWMNISGKPCADMNYALASEGCLSITEQDE